MLAGSSADGPVTIPYCSLSVAPPQAPGLDHDWNVVQHHLGHSCCVAALLGCLWGDLGA